MIFVIIPQYFLRVNTFSSPPSPIPSHNGFPDGNYPSHFDGMGSLDSRSTARSLDSARDDEHRLIARYAAKLAQEQRTGMVI